MFVKSGQMTVDLPAYKETIELEFYRFAIDVLEFNVPRSEEGERADQFKKATVDIVNLIKCEDGISWKDSVDMAKARWLKNYMESKSC